MRRSNIKKRPWIINLVLFVATALTTTFVGAFYANERIEGWIPFFLRGWVFSVPLMAILLVHEMGHYLAGRKLHLDVTPPYFIPGYLPAGTFGAFIKIRSPILNRKELVQIGAWGPVSGAIIAIPLLVLGLWFSEIRPEKLQTEGFSLGSSIILELLCLIRFGEFSFNTTIILHPTAMAAWFGLFVTAMNLLPIGQLDGGHVIYGLFGPRASSNASLGFFCALVPIGVFLWPGWLVFGLLVYFLGLRHPAPMDPETPPDRSTRILGWAAIILFFITFIPVPLALPE